jgi:signal transduction histidine kinase
MSQSRSRFSRRHLLALCTFLVPLGALAVLGQSELQRQGTMARSALEREAKTFLASAVQALEQQFDRLPPIVDRSRELLTELGPLRTTITLREHEGFAPLLDLVLLDDQGELTWPILSTQILSLPFGRDARPRGDETAITGALQSSDLLLTTGRTAEAARLLQHLVERFEEANPAGRSGRRDPDEPELAARFQLGAARRALGEHEAARLQFETVRAATTGMRGARGGIYADATTLGLLAEASLAELGTGEDRIKLLRAIAEGNRQGPADGMLTAIAVRLVDRIATSDPLRDEATVLLREERQRAQTRSFAGDYDGFLKSDLRFRMRPGSRAATTGDTQLVSTLAGKPTVLWVRTATEMEVQQLQCTRVGLRFDLDQLLQPALPQLVSGTGTFVLSILDPKDVPMVPPPASSPEDFVPPVAEVHGLTLRAHPANTQKLVAEAQAAERNRAFLLIALFLTAVGGALWLWRSVSREAELASLKVDLVSRVSHELKTPLALIRMYGETLGLGRARDSQQAAQFGDIIARESERLTTLIQRILDFSRQQAGTLQYSVARVDLASLLRSVCEAYAPHLEARGAILIDSLRPDVFAPCDANACESAIVNLLENAAKYGIEGDDEHEIELDLRPEAGFAVIEVRDRGRGIPDGEGNRVFDGFYRASNSGEVRGAGLGLSLVRHFARAHGGDVTVSARDGGGSVFRLTLPLASPPLPTPSSSTDAAGGAPTASRPSTT